MKKFISLALALVMALSLTTVAWGAGVACSGTCTHEAAIGDEHYDKLADAVADAVDTETVVLLQNIAFTGSNRVVVEGGKKIALDLNGKTLSAEVSVIKVDGTGTELTIKDGVGTGKVLPSGSALTNAALFITNGAKATLMSGTLESAGSYTVALGYGSAADTFVMSGGTVKNNCADSNPIEGAAIMTGDANGGSVTMTAGKVIAARYGVVIKKGSFTMGGGTIEATNNFAISTNGALDGAVSVSAGTVTSTNDAAIYHASTGALNITGGTITGATGVYVKSGSVSITGGTISGTGTAANYTFNADGCTPTGDALVIENVGGSTGYEAITSVSVTGGTFTSTNADAVASYAATSVNSSAVAVDEFIEGGTFSGTVPAALLADDVQQLANGSVVTTPAAGAVAPTLYVWDTAAKDWATYYIATGDDLDDLKLGADENCLPCYFVDGRYFVDTTEAAATYKLVYGATKLFLAPVDSTDVCYDAKATVFTNVTKKTDECGKLVVTDTTKTYYVFYDENDYDEDYYFVATKNGSIQLLVGGKIVDVELNAAQDLTAHVWKGHDVVNNAYTTAKCENCGKVVKLYATGTAAGKGAHYEAGLGYITKIDNGFGPAVVTPSTDKVESAETFDAGIAMYVGMSVMAAAGSAVVLKKKD